MTGSLFNLAKTIVSALPRELEYRVEKHKYEKLEVIQICYDPREPIANPKYQLVNKPSWTFDGLLSRINFLSKDQLTKEKDRILMKELVSNK